MAFPPKLGCPLCSIVSTAAQSSSSPSLSVASTQPEVLWRDENFTIYRERANPVSSKGHLIVAFNLHVPSIYTLSSSDLPLLVNVRSLSTHLLSTLLPSSPSPSNATATSTSTPLHRRDAQFRIGFITPPFKDSKIPVTDHLHAHAFIVPANLMGWWRGVAYSPMAWYDIDDLIAEIRETVSNNRVKSGYENRPLAPIDMVPHAGARSGTTDGIETSEPGLGSTTAEDMEGGYALPTVQSPAPTTLTPQVQIPQLHV